MRTIFWVSLLLIAYAYVGYPCGLALWARLGARRVQRRLGAAMPGVSIVLAARNEVQRLPWRIANLLALDYQGPTQIIVVSDGSTDGTARALAPHRDRIELVEIAAAGKAAALNAGVARARYDILVFADARQWFAPDALTRLVANFADPRVGGATGELILDCERGGARRHESGVAEGVGLYWRYEKWIRRNESLVHSTLGATGAIYALRRQLWRPLRPGTILDDVVAPMRAVLQGYRVVFDDRARAFDEVAADGHEEQRRKVRTIAGNYQILSLEPALLNPLSNPVWLQYLSHKIVPRLVVPFALMALFASSATLAFDGALYALVFGGQLGFYGLAIYGAALDRSTRQARTAGARAWPMPQAREESVQ